MKILIIAHYVSFPWETGNCRFIYLANLLRKDNEVELITSNFYHTKKNKRELKSIDEKKLGFKITLLNEPEYQKNVSLKRIISHKKLSLEVKKYLDKKEEKPDLIYCSVPSLDVAYEAIKYGSKNNIRCIIDVQDLWPESFKMAINIPVISDIIFYPMMRKANYIYSHSDEVVAVSQTFVKRALENNNQKQGISVFLGTDLNYFDKCALENKIKYNDDITRIVYIGTLGTSYDIKSIIDAIKILNNKGISNLKFIVIGDGPLKPDFEDYAKNKNINYEFTGRLDYQKMVGILCSCDIAVNPINGFSVSSIINKVGDYAAAGLPVINTQNSAEYRELLDKYHAGLNCINGDVKDIAEKMDKLVSNKKERITMGKANRLMATELFDRNKTYNEIIKRIIG